MKTGYSQRVTFDIGDRVEILSPNELGVPVFGTVIGHTVVESYMKHVLRLDKTYATKHLGFISFLLVDPHKLALREEP